MIFLLHAVAFCIKLFDITWSTHNQIQSVNTRWSSDKFTQSFFFSFQTTPAFEAPYRAFCRCIHEIFKIRKNCEIVAQDAQQLTRQDTLSSPSSQVLDQPVACATPLKIMPFSDISSPFSKKIKKFLEIGLKPCQKSRQKSRQKYQNLYTIFVRWGMPLPK